MAPNPPSNAAGKRPDRPSSSSAKHRTSFLSASPLVRESLRRDLAELEDDGTAIEDEDEEEDSDDEDQAEGFSAAKSLAASYKGTNYLSGTYSQNALPGYLHNKGQPTTKHDRDEAIREERSLLRDNNVIPPKHTIEEQESALGRVRSLLPGVPGGSRSQAEPSSSGDAGTRRLSETAPLLGDPTKPYGGQADPKNVEKKWEEAVAAGLIKTTWQRETKVVLKYALPLIPTFLLQYSLTFTTIFTVGHLGKVELGAVSLGSMTAVITGYSVYQGLATSLDTLCAQAYGSGKKKLVGLQFQRMTLFLWTISVPIIALWLLSEPILTAIVPEKETARLAALYLRILSIGAPFLAVFEAGKRYVFAQGLFSATLYVLLICAPLNAFMNWLFVWKLGWGFIGAPIAVAITDVLLPVMLLLYVLFVDGRQCWPGFSRKAWTNWGAMIRLALPGLLMVEAECLAFEILTLASAYFGTTALAAQSVLSTVATLMWQFPFPVSIAASTRIANLIGATLADAAKTTTIVGLFISVVIGAINMTLLTALRNVIPAFFTSDADVLDLVSRVLPICAAFQLFDALAAMCNGILRGIGRQEIGGYIQLACYYIVAMPISFGTAFGLDWELYGLWTGVAIALGLVAIAEGVCIRMTNWQKSVTDAQTRNEAD